MKKLKFTVKQGYRVFTFPAEDDLGGTELEIPDEMVQVIEKVFEDFDTIQKYLNDIWDKSR